MELSYQDSVTPEDLNGTEEISIDEDDDEAEVPKVNGIHADDAEIAEKEGAEEDDEEESELDSDFDMNSIIRTTTIASLIPEKVCSVLFLFLTHLLVRLVFYDLVKPRIISMPTD